jgi:Fe-S-cluster containining protein
MMELDFTPYLEKYKAIAKMADEIFKRVKTEHPDCVKCEIKCADCCHALFDMTLIEAIYINCQFNQKFQGRERELLLEKANRADRKVHMIKRKAYKELQSGKNEADILMELAGERCRCALLNDDDLCDLYEHRPITCRLYGIPTSVGGIAHTCGQAGFVEGQQYPSVNLDTIQQKLFAVSQELVANIKTKYVKMADMLVPVSMAMLTDFDPEYLGIINPKADTEKEGKDND